MFNVPPTIDVLIPHATLLEPPPIKLQSDDAVFNIPPTIDVLHV